MINQELNDLLTPLVADLGLALWGIEFNPGAGNSLLRVYIEAVDRPVTVEDCESVSRELEIMRVSHEVETEQVRALAERRAGRDDDAVKRAIEEMLAAAREDRNMVPPMLEACRVEATLGEICDALRAEWGEYREPARF